MQIVSSISKKSVYHENTVLIVKNISNSSYSVSKLLDIKQFNLVQVEFQS